MSDPLRGAGDRHRQHEADLFPSERCLSHTFQVPGSDSDAAEKQALCAPQRELQRSLWPVACSTEPQRSLPGASTHHPGDLLMIEARHIAALTGLAVAAGCQVGGIDGGAAANDDFKAPIMLVG